MEVAAGVVTFILFVAFIVGVGFVLLKFMNAYDKNRIAAYKKRAEKLKQFTEPELFHFKALESLDRISRRLGWVIFFLVLMLFVIGGVSSAIAEIANR